MNDLETEQRQSFEEQENPPSPGVFENLSASARLEEAPLDDYSRVVRQVTQNLEPSVVAVGPAEGQGAGRSVGSGVIVGWDGRWATVVTNSHVVRGLGQSLRQSPRRIETVVEAEAPGVAADET